MRIFVAIPISSRLAEEFIRIQRDFADLPVRFTPPEELHVTIVPPWDADDWHDANEVIRQGIRGFQPFTLRMQRVEYGPTAKLPRLIWSVAKPSDQYATLRDRLLRALGLPDDKPATPHITLARFHEKIGKKLRDQPITRRVEVTMPVASMVLYSSERQPGIGYTELTRYHFR